MDVEAQVREHQGPRRPMEENHLVEAKAEHEMGLELAGPRGEWVIPERSVKGERPPSRRSVGGGQELSGGVALRSLTREPSVGVGNDDEADGAKCAEFISKFRRDGDGRMEDELPVGEPDYSHANRDPNQPSLPTEQVLGAPEIRVVPN